MAEPQTTAAGSAFGLGLVSAVLGPVLGHWALIFVGAGIGAFLAVSAANTSTVRAALPVLVKSLVIALMLTGATATIIAPHVGTTVDVLLPPLSFLLAWRHDKVGALIDWAVGLIRPKRGTE
jgi:hypothetical protein